MTLSFEETPLAGAYVVTTEVHEDERGTFVRTFDADLFAQHGLVTTYPQASSATNWRAGTLRGMHWQREPWPEVKVVRCVRGAVFDVLVDLREGSPTHRQWWGIDLAHAGTALYVPAGLAHGYLTLTPDTELTYLISAPYHPESAAGFRWDDSAVGIVWPREPLVVSERDRGYLPLD